jgi:hypothetical protein
VVKGPDDVRPTMQIATPEETQRFLSTLWFQWGMTLVKKIATEYSLNEPQAEALSDILLKPNDWVIDITD